MEKASIKARSKGRLSRKEEENKDVMRRQQERNQNKHTNTKTKL
jgi:hypothetical protein